MAHFLNGLPGRGILDRVRLYLPPPNFISLHYLYFIGTCLLTSIIFYCTSTPQWSVTYTDSLFLVVSAMTEAGLNTVNLSQLNTFQQWLLWMHILCGGAIFVSIFVVHVRKRAFENRFGDALKEQQKQRKNRQASSRDNFGRTLSRRSLSFRPGTSQANEENRVTEKPDLHQLQNLNGSAGDDLRIDRGRAKDPLREIDTAVKSDTHNDTLGASPTVRGETKDSNNMELVDSGSNQNATDHITFLPGTTFNPTNTMDRTSRIRRRSSVFSLTGVGASPVTASFRRPFSSDVHEDQFRRPSMSTHDPAAPRYIGNLLRKEVVGRNSQFHGLTKEEREQLGGVEYRAIYLLSWIVPLYFVMWQLLSCLALGAWMNNFASDITKFNGINPWWNGAFNAVSAFNNSGMSLLDANMIPFQQFTYPVFTMGLLILAGNTAYPVFLRLILWVMHRLCPSTANYSEWKHTLRFTLDHPRRVYTNLFPAAPSWWLVASLVVLNGSDWLAFEVLNFGNPTVTSIPPGSRALDGLFQALAVRSGGFYIVPISSVRIGVQVLYVLMMYISVYPVVITMRNSNVYEERSLGIYADDPAEKEKENDPELGKIGRLKRTMTGFKAPSDTRNYFIRQQVRGQLAHDLSWLAIAVFLIVCIENSQFENDPITFSVFNVVFEVVSAYGCVGITTGLPDQAYSFSGAWHVVSKLILCAVMLRGRHRGLPVAIDRAVLLPGEGLGRKEEEDHDIRTGGNSTFDIRQRRT